MESRVREVLSAPASPRPVPPAQPARAPEPQPRLAEPAAQPTPAPTQRSEPKPAPAPPPQPIAPPVQTASPLAAGEESGPTQSAAQPEAEALEFFECPECGTKVPNHASSCPGCGVMFAEEGAEMFQCPACNALVDIDSKSCPGCGAIFVESEGDAPAEAVQEAPQVEIEAPIAEVKPETVVPEAQRAPEPGPVSQPVPEPEPALAQEQAGRKGIGGFGWFKKRKKEPEPVIEMQEPRYEPVRPPPQAPASTYQEQTRIPEPEVARTLPTPAPAAYARREPTPVDSKDKGKELARLVAEMKPLLALANEKDIDIAESKRLIDEAAEAGRDRQLDKALEFVNRSRGILMARIDEHLSSAIMQLKEETAVARSLGGDVSRSLTYLREMERAKAAGDAEAAFVYADRLTSELQPITGRYKDARNKTAALKSLVTDCETLILDTKEARLALAEASKAFEANDFDRVELLVKQATDRLYRAIPDRVNEEMHAAKAQLIEAKMKNVNTTPMITILKSVRTLMKAGDYQQALREMKEFKEQIRRVM